MKTFEELNSFLVKEGLKDYLVKAAQGTTNLVSSGIRLPAKLGKAVHSTVVGNEPLIANAINKGLAKIGGNNDSVIDKSSQVKSPSNSKMVEIKLTPELNNKQLKRGDIVKGVILSKDPYSRQPVQGEYMGKSEIGIVIRNPQSIGNIITSRKRETF